MKYRCPPETTAGAEGLPGDAQIGMHSLGVPEQFVVPDASNAAREAENVGIGVLSSSFAIPR